MRRCTFYLLLAAVVASVSLVVLFATSPSPSPLPATTVVALLYPLPSTPSGFLASLSSLLSSEDEAEDAVDCGTLPYCTLIARTSCGWCWDDGTARRGGHRGDVQGTCRDWTWQVTQCSLHVLCSSLASCQGIVGTTCGWCAGVGGMRGGVSGPQSGACAASAWIFDYTQCPVLPGPQQVHLMYGEDAATMVVTWSSHTNSSSLAHVVDLDVDGGSSADTHSGDVRSFTHNNAAGLQWVHRVNVTGLLAGHRYVYWVQSDAYASSNFSFTALTPAQPSDPHRFVVYGDMGRFGGEPALSAVQAEVLSSLDSESPVTAVLHLGDFAYDMLDFGGANGDAFMARIEPIAARVPYVTTPGNHETEADSLYSHYRHRFTMPGSWAGDGWRLYFSFNAGLIHFLSYNTEALFAPNPLDGGMQQQLDWLRDDLERANRNRQQQPWIVAFGHRPMYCSNTDGDDCTMDDGPTRLTFERLFDEMGVDLVLEAHEHSYERMFPVFDLVTLQSDYVEPFGMVHVVTGTAGCNEQAGTCINPLPGPRGDWSAVRSANRLMYGYGHLAAPNSTHLYWDEVMVEEGGARLDAIWIVQHAHGNFSRRREQAGWSRDADGARAHPVSPSQAKCS